MMTSRSKALLISGVVVLTTPIAVFAHEADVVSAEVTAISGGYNFNVTVLHADSGWDHYADAFEIVSPNGDVLGARKLLHPHVNEQPFTRSLTGVTIPNEIGSVSVRAHDSVHGLGGAAITLVLPDRQ